jgi:hypothetical protein
MVVSEQPGQSHPDQSLAGSEQDGEKEETHHLEVGGVAGKQARQEE